MAALMERSRTGKGQKVEGALLHTALAFNGSLLLEQAVLGRNRYATGNRSQFAGPSDIYRTKDGSIIVQVAGRPLFERWAALMGETHWRTDPRFADDISCGDNGELLSSRMQLWCQERTTEEALAALEAARIPCGPIYAPAQTIDDPHVKAAGFFESVDYPGLARPAPLTTTPIKLSATPGSIAKRAPTLGEHTNEVLRGLGYSAGEISALRARGVI
jgi:crotonobetainyl-CoA:carnitine CoA-transferase CaiB-like acyl-CoA transferase